ncbi:cold-shock protein [Ensifer sp. ENS09]|nr:cold-shock protein [Ensifer sp. ENS09]
MLASGAVKWFNSTKGLGFIQQGDGVSMCSCLSRRLNALGSPADGQKATFDVVSDRKSGKSSDDNLRPE